MTTFKEIRGTTIEVVSSDPSNPETGQIWYNSSSGTLKGYKAVNAWSSGGNLNTARGGLAASGISNTSALVFGGLLAPFPAAGPVTTATESYNGTSWTSVNSMINKRTALFGGGTQTAAWAAGGYDDLPGGATSYNYTENWNGTSWTASGTINQARNFGGSAGIQTAAIIFGGYRYTPPYQASSATESYNGSAWTTVNSLNQTRYNNSGFGIQTAAITANGYLTTGITNTTESWNGTSWTNIPAITNTLRDGFASSGTQTAGMIFGGYIQPTGPNTGATELWNGTSWTTSPGSMATARRSLTGNGTQNSSLASGGYTTAFVATTESWTGLKTQTITVS